MAFLPCAILPNILRLSKEISLAPQLKFEGGGKPRVIIFQIHDSCLRRLKPNLNRDQPKELRRWFSNYLTDSELHELFRIRSAYHLNRRLFSDKVNSTPSVVKRPTKSETSTATSTSTLGAAAALFANKKKMAGNKAADSIVWIDCEMSGLDVTKDRLMEISCIITGPDLEIIGRHPPIIIKTPDDVLNGMSAWCIQHHGQSGLTQSCRESNISVEEAERRLFEFVTSKVPPGVCPLGGNSVHMDRVFLSIYMPNLINYLHYRNIDVSTIKEVTRRWFPHEFSNAPKKRFQHRTDADIEDSIEELKYYRSAVFKSDILS